MHVREARCVCTRRIHSKDRGYEERKRVAGTRVDGVERGTGTGFNLRLVRELTHGSETSMCSKDVYSVKSLSGYQTCYGLAAEERREVSRVS